MRTLRSLGPALVATLLLAGAANAGDARASPSFTRKDVTQPDKPAPQQPQQPRVWRLDDAVLAAVLADARKRASSATARVVSSERVTWSDGSIGCPEPGMRYTQALISGWRAVVEAGDQTLTYHGTTAA